VKEVNRKVLVIAVALMAVAMLATPLVATVFAAKPIKNDDVWFVAAVMSSPTEMGKTWWTGGGTILHMKGRLRDWGVFRSLPGSPGAILIGSMTTLIESFAFNTKTSNGRLILKVTISLT